MRLLYVFKKLQNINTFDQNVSNRGGVVMVVIVIMMDVVVMIVVVMVVLVL